MSSNPEFSSPLEEVLNKLAIFTEKEKVTWREILGVNKLETIFISLAFLFFIILLLSLRWFELDKERYIRQTLTWLISIFLLLFFLFFIAFIVIDFNRAREISNKLNKEYSTYNPAEAVKAQQNVSELLRFDLETLVLAEEHIKYLIKKLQIGKTTYSSSSSVFSFLLLVTIAAIFVNIPQFIEIIRQKYLGKMLDDFT